MIGDIAPDERRRSAGNDDETLSLIKTEHQQHQYEQHQTATTPSTTTAITRHQLETQPDPAVSTENEQHQFLQQLLYYQQPTPSSSLSSAVHAQMSNDTNSDNNAEMSASYLMSLSDQPLQPQHQHDVSKKESDEEINSKSDIIERFLCDDAMPANGAAVAQSQYIVQQSQASRQSSQLLQQQASSTSLDDSQFDIHFDFCSSEQQQKTNISKKNSPLMGSDGIIEVGLCCVCSVCVVRPYVWFLCVFASSFRRYAAVRSTTPAPRLAEIDAPDGC